ncbi:MAG: ATP synthase F1 subunit gamma [Patescibacteria group bacterium]
MAGTKEIKRRIKSVKSTKKITKAMELVAASKMKRAVSSTLASRFYAGYSWEILTSIAQNIESTDFRHPLFEQRPVKNILLVLITSNRGLCGAYNAQVIKKAIAVLKNESAAKVSILAIGKKGDAAMRRVGQNIIASFTELPDNITLQNILPISKMLTNEYTKGNYDKVVVAYTDFVSALTQKPNIKQILPVSKSDIKELIEGIKSEDVQHNEIKTNYLFEGNMEELITSLAEKLTRMQIYQMMLESNASEQSSRMVAMKNASEASGEMIDELTLIFNKARQSNITREISEISAGMASVS